MIQIFLMTVYCLSILGLAGAMLRACWTDFTRMTLSNRLCMVMAVLFIPAWGAAYGLGMDVFQSLVSHGGAAAIMLAVTFILFQMGVWGGGDSKLVAALSLWLGVKGLMPFMMVMAIAGLVLILMMPVIRRVPARFWTRAGSWPARVQAGEKILPYGIAIIAGAAFAFARLGYFDVLSLIQSVG